MGARVLITIIIFFLLFVSIYFPGDLLEDQFANAHKYPQCVVVHNFTSEGWWFITWLDRTIDFSNIDNSFVFVIDCKLSQSRGEGK